MFKNDLIYYGLAKVISIILSLFTIKILSSNLTVTKFGEVDLYLISISLISIVIGFGINSAINRELNLFDRKIADVITSSMVFSLKSLLVVFLLYFLNTIVDVVQNETTILLILLSSLVFTVNEIFVGLMRSLSKSKLYFYLTIIQNLIYLNLIFNYAENLSINNILFAYLISFKIVLLVNIFFFRKSLIGKFDKTIYKSLAYYGIPLIFSALAGFIFNVSDKYMLGYYRDLNEVGLYAIAYKVASLVTIVIGIIQMAWPKYMFKIYKEKTNYMYIYDFVSRYYLFVLISLGLFVILFSNFFILLFSSEKYLVGSVVIPIIVFGMVLIGFQNISNQGIHVTGKSHIMTSIIIVGGIVNIGLNYLFIPTYGYMAAAWTTFISMMVMQMLTFYFSTKLLHIDYSYIRLLFSYILFLVLAISFKDSEIFLKISIYILSVFFIFGVLCKKEDLKFVKENIFKK